MIRRVALCLLGATCALGGGCASGRPMAASVPARHPWTVPGRLRIASSYSMSTLNPLLGNTIADAAFGRLYSDVLVSEDSNGRLVPDLAAEVPTTENGGISADGLTIHYKLRKNVKWQDAQPFTSADVKFTFDAVMNPANDVSARVGFDDVSRVDVPDARTVVFHLRHRYAPFVTTVFGDGWGVLPAHILAREKTLNDVPFNAMPVGTGPFRVVRWERGNRIELRRNDEYFMGRPKLESVTIELVSDEDAEVSQLRAHEIDWAFQLSSSAYRTVRGTANGELRFVLTPVNESMALFFNNAKKPTEDARIRKAIVFALDKAGLTRRLTFGTAVVATQDIPSFMRAYDPTLRPTPYDPGRAKALLADAGYGPGHPLTLDSGGRGPSRRSTPICADSSPTRLSKPGMPGSGRFSGIGFGQPVPFRLHQGRRLYQAKARRPSRRRPTKSNHFRNCTACITCMCRGVTVCVTIERRRRKSFRPSPAACQLASACASTSSRGQPMFRLNTTLAASAAIVFAVSIPAFAQDALTLRSVLIADIGRDVDAVSVRTTCQHRRHGADRDRSG